MALLNYTTTVAPNRTLGQITDRLVKHGATQVLGEYDAGSITGIAFAVTGPTGMQRYRLPLNVSAVEKVLGADRNVPRRLKTRDQAERVAWRILKDWIEAQLAIVETQMVSLDQVMLPYLLVQGGTLYDLYASRQLELEAGDE